MDIRTKSLLEIHMAVLLFGMTGLFGKFLTIPAQYIVLGRVFFACIAVGLYLKLRKISFKMSSRRDYATAIAIGTLLAFHWTAFYKSVQVSTVAIALLTFSAYPIFVTFFEPALFREKLKKTDVIAAFIMFIGVIFIVPEFDLSNNLTIGTLWGMAGCMSFAVMSLLNRMLASKYNGGVINFYEQSTATIVLLPMLLFYRPEMSAADWGLVIILGVFLTGLAHSLFIGGMKNVRAQTAGIIASLESVYGIVFAAIIIGEIPSLRELIGGVIILGTAFISTLKSSQETSSSKIN